MQFFTSTVTCIFSDPNLEQLLSPRIDSMPFQPSIKRLQQMFDAYTRACPPPWPAPGLQLTPEIRYQSELWLPLSAIRPVFERFYRSSLICPPVISSTPFADSASWADVVTGFPEYFRRLSNPAALLKQLLEDKHLRIPFLFHSFLPRRFYGGLVRYPEQEQFIRRHLAGRHKHNKGLRCLDAASGDGVGSYGLAKLLLEQGWPTDTFSIEGWTLDPLEAWAAAHVSFPHDRKREQAIREWVAPVFESGAASAMLFKQADLSQPPEYVEQFDLILCNGLLGGPIINQKRELELIVGNLTALLAPGGKLLAADSFHGGWKKDIPRETLGDVFNSCGLIVSEAGEGICGAKV